MNFPAEDKQSFLIHICGKNRNGLAIREHVWGTGLRSVLFLSGFADPDRPCGQALLRWKGAVLAGENGDGTLEGFDLKSLKNRCRIRLLPHLDPDTAELNRNGIQTIDKSFENTGNSENLFLNRRGVDLNRNFSSNWIRMKMEDPSRTDCGLFPESEPEAAVLTADLRRDPPHAALVIRAGRTGIFYPEQATAKEVREAFFLGRYANLPVSREKDADGSIQQWMTFRGIKVLTLHLQQIPPEQTLYRLFCMYAALT